MNGYWRRSDEEDEHWPQEPDFSPMTAGQARQWALRNPEVSVWRVVVLQMLAAVAAALLGWVFSGSAHVGMSAGYGALAVALPAAVFALALTKGGPQRQDDAAAVMLRFFGCELLKLALTIAMLAMASRVVPQVSWLAVVLGLVVTVKVYWVALLLPGAGKMNKQERC